MSTPATTATTTRRHRVKPAALAAATATVGQRVGSAPTVGSQALSAGTTATVGGLPVLRFVMPNGVLELQDAATTVRLLENEQAARLAAEAEQAALATVYRLTGEPDASLPHGGLLTRRLGISVRTAAQLLTDGRLRYTCTGGTKGYRVSELAVREFLGDRPPPT